MRLAPEQTKLLQTVFCPIFFFVMDTNIAQTVPNVYLVRFVEMKQKNQSFLSEIIMTYIVFDEK